MYGNCSSDFTVKTRKGNVATEISIERNLEKCDGFEPISTGVSPLALIKGAVSFTSALLFTQALSSLLLTLWEVRNRRDLREAAQLLPRTDSSGNCGPDKESAAQGHVSGIRFLIPNPERCPSCCHSVTRTKPSAIV